MRPVELPDDEDFLKRLYFSTREDDAAAWGLPPEHLEPLLDMQYRAQKTQYGLDYPGNVHVILLFDGEQVGRLMTETTETALNGIDLALLTEHRNKGIGDVVMKGLMNKADELGIPFLFSVVKTNYKAIKFYQRLGIAFTGETVSHYLLEWSAARAAANNE